MSKDNIKSKLRQGDTVFVPANIWPTEKPPKGKKGWEGQIVKEKDTSSWVVSFKGDPTKYFFKKSDLEKWTRAEFGATTAVPVKTPCGAGPSSNTSNGGSSSLKKKAMPKINTVPMKKSAAPKMPAPSPKKEDVEAAKVIQEIETLLPLIDLQSLKSIRIDIRRMAGA